MQQKPLTHPDQLRGLSISVLGHRQAGPIKIRDATIDGSRREAWEAQLNRAYFACGCPQSALAMTFAAFAYILAVVVFQPDLGPAWAYAAWGALATIAGAIIGKLVGLHSANRRLRALTEAIHREWPAESREGYERFDCG